MPTLNAATLLDVLSDSLVEDMGSKIQESGPDSMEDPYFMLKTTSMGVTSDGLGRDFKAIHVMEEGVAGTAKWVALSGGVFDLTGAGLADLAGHVGLIQDANVVSYPGADEAGVVPGLFRKTITLAKGMGNTMAPEEFATASALDPDNVLADMIDRIVTRSARNAMNAELGCFYAISAKQELGTVGTVGVQSNNLATNDVTTVVVKGGSIRQFEKGMWVDLYDSAGTTKQNSTYGYMVTDVRWVPDGADAGYGAVSLQSLPAVNITTTNGGAESPIVGDILIRRDSISAGVGLGFIGPGVWLTDTGTVYGMSLARYQQLKSIMYSAGGVLSEGLLNKLFGRYFKAYGLGNMPDTVITSPGCVTAAVENNQGLQRFDRTNKPYTYREGYDISAIPFTYRGRTVKIAESAYMPTDSLMNAASQTGGRAWCLKMRDGNVRRYIPKKPSGYGGHEKFGREIFFRNGTPFKMYHSTTGKSTNLDEAPWFRYVAVCPIVLPGINMSGLTESL